MAPRIPILNIFYVFCYAWRLIIEGRALAAGAEDSPNTETLFARVLLNGTRLLLRRGLERDYAVVDDEIATIRGRVLLEPSFRRMLLQKGKARCAFDELCHDTLINQILKATLLRLSKAIGVDSETRRDISSMAARLDDVSVIQLEPSVFSRAVVHRNNGYYDLIIKICELIHRQLLPTESPGRFKISDLLDDEPKMSAIFEEFVRVFYQTEFKGVFYSVKREDIQWDATAMDTLHASHLPKMQTDATLRSSGRTIIVDAKYYRSIFSVFRGSEKVRAAHLYQMFSYLRNCRASNSERPEGILLYPSSRESMTLDYELGGHKIRIATVDLHVEWQKIDARLRLLVAVPQESAVIA